MPRHPPCALISLTYSRIMSCFSTEELFEIVFYPLNFFNWISLISSLLFRYSIFKEHLSLLDIWSPWVLFGGDEENRTPDPLLARQVLSQLSYTPKLSIKLNQSMVGTNGLEPSTSRLSGVRSNHLSYAPIYLFERIWWAQMDSNHRPHAYQACALTTWAMRPLFKFLQNWTIQI